VKAACYALLAAAAAGCVALALALGAGVLLAGWLMLPYAGLAVGLRFARQAAAYFLVVLLVAGGGFLFLADIIFGRPDAQGALAVVFTPIYQGIAIAVLLPFAMWLAARRTRA
jgi:hypothetical protein